MHLTAQEGVVGKGMRMLHGEVSETLKLYKQRETGGTAACRICEKKQTGWRSGLWFDECSGLKPCREKQEAEQLCRICERKQS